MARTTDVYASVTARIVEMIDAGIADPAAWRKPWQSIGARHTSAAGRTYRGINTLLLADSAARAGYVLPIWATYRQWATYGAQVNRGEHGTTVVLWKAFTRKATADEDASTRRGGMFATTFSVFNAAQVVGAAGAPAVIDLLDAVGTPRNADGRIPAAELFMANTGARIDYGGDRAYYTPAADRIALPMFEDFDSAETFYSTAAHELTPWSGHDSRLARDLSGRFGTAQYAAEELVAELGAAFTMARLGIAAEPRADHAHYLANWAQLLRGDSRAIFTAASAAQRAADFLAGESADQVDASTTAAA